MIRCFLCSLQELEKCGQQGRVPGVLPVDVQAVEIVGAQEFSGVIDELVHAEHVGSEFLEGCRAESPSADGQDDLELGILVAQTLQPRVHVDVQVGRFLGFVIGQREPVVLERSESVDQVGAHGRIDVFRREAAQSRPAGRPAGVVADHFGVAGIAARWCWLADGAESWPLGGHLVEQLGQ